MKGDVKVIVSGSSGHIVIDESSLIKRILLYLISAIIGFGAMFLAIMMDSRAYPATLTEIFMGTFEDAYTGGDPDEIAQMPETGDVITIYINIDTTTSPYPRQVRIFASNTFSYIRSNRLQLKLCYIILRNTLVNIKFTHELIDYLFIRSIKTTEILDKLNNRCLLCYTRSKSTHICHLLSYFFVIFTAERYQYRSVKAELECAGNIFTATGTTVVEPGWKKYDAVLRSEYKIRMEKEDEDLKSLPPLTEGFMFKPAECKVVPLNEDMDRHTLEAMVQDVNVGQVAPEERLSDHVYMYDSQEKELVLADKMEERQQQRAEAQKDAKEAEQADKAGKTERGEKKPERERVSMKEKLPEKKAEVAKNEANREHPVPSKTKETARG